MAAHANLGASGASRWIGCPGSVRLIRELPQRLRSRTSIYADEGTAAHKLGEHCLEDPERMPEQFRGKKIKGELQSWPVNDDMINAVTIYVEYIRKRQAEMGPGTRLHLEATVRPLPEFEDMYGTGDAILYEPFGELEVVDYKHGAGVWVDEEDNDQMKYYGLGALVNIGPLDVSSVTTTIIQPRVTGEKPIRPWHTTPAELLQYGDILRAARIEAEKPDAPLNPGDHCRFCPAAALCPALQKKAAVTVREDFSEFTAANPTADMDVQMVLPDADDPEALALAMQLAPVVVQWAKKVDEMAMNNALHGVQVKGHKLVRKRANRAWLDPVDLERRLRNKRGVTVSDMFKQTLKSPAQLEKLAFVGKEFVAEHCEKPKGGLTLVPEEDPREAESLLYEFADAIELDTQD